MNITTQQLMSELTKSKDIKTFLGEYEDEFRNISFPDFLNDMLAQKNMTVAHVVRMSGQGDYIYKVFNNVRKPSREIAIRIAIGMGLNIDETQLLLRIGRFAILDPRDKQDSIVIYAIENKLSIDRLTDLLDELEQPSL